MRSAFASVYNARSHVVSRLNVASKLTAHAPRDKHSIKIFSCIEFSRRCADENFLHNKFFSTFGLCVQTRRVCVCVCVRSLLFRAFFPSCAVGRTVGRSVVRVRWIECARVRVENTRSNKRARSKHMDGTETKRNVCLRAYLYGCQRALVSVFASRACMCS